MEVMQHPMASLAVGPPAGGRMPISAPGAHARADDGVVLLLSGMSNEDMMQAMNQVNQQCCGVLVLSRRRAMHLLLCTRRIMSALDTWRPRRNTMAHGTDWVYRVVVCATQASKVPAGKVRRKKPKGSRAGGSSRPMVRGFG